MLLHPFASPSPLLLSDGSSSFLFRLLFVRSLFEKEIVNYNIIKANGATHTHTQKKKQQQKETTLDHTLKVERLIKNFWVILPFSLLYIAQLHPSIHPFSLFSMAFRLTAISNYRQHTLVVSLVSSSLVCSLSLSLSLLRQRTKFYKLVLTKELQPSRTLLLCVASVLKIWQEAAGGLASFTTWPWYDFLVQRQTWEYLKSSEGRLSASNGVYQTAVEGDDSLYARWKEVEIYVLFALAL